MKFELKKNNLLLIYLISFIYLEFLFKILLYDNFFRMSILNMLFFLIFFSFLMFFLSKLFKENVNKAVFFVVLGLFCLWFSAQYVVKSFFDFYISFSVLQIAGQIGDFMGKVVLEVIKRLFQIFLFFLPVVISAFLHKKINFKRSKAPKLVLIFFVCLITWFGYIISLNIGKKSSYSPYELFYKVNNPALNIEKIGVINSLTIDSYRFIFGFEEKIDFSPVIKTPKPVEKEYDLNILNIDFDVIINSSENENVKDISSYFKNDTGTYQNEYTSFFKGKNLILIMAESFNEIAVRKDTTPTLYKLTREGFVFNNFYTPTISSTIGGEFQELTGLYANYSSLSPYKKGKVDFPFGIATTFQKEGYKTYAYHNNSYVFQDRNVYLEKLGFTNFKGCYNGMEKLINCEIWPQSDVDMIEATTKDYLNNDEPFMVFYASVSGHASYNYYNAMSKKHQKEIQALNLGYSEPVEAYLAAQMEFDQSIERLIKKLDEAGKLDNTVIAFVGDHYPYELTIDQINEASTYVKDDEIEVNRSYFVLWNNKMKPITIEKVGSQMDVLPTIYNVFGIKYDSRLIMGKDILSSEGGLAMFGTRSWVSDKGSYYTSTGTFVPKKGVTVDNEYINNMNKLVNNRINISSYIVDNNYYNIVWNYIK